MESEASAITNRPLRDSIAFTSERGEANTKSVECFIKDVYALADLLPENRPAINFCGNRYRFMVAFFAVCLKGQTNYLPPNRSPDMQLQLREHSDKLYLLHDSHETESELETFQYPEQLRIDGIEPTIPTIPPDHLCALSFTSGSTGKSTAVEKRWHTLRAGAHINAAHMLSDTLQKTPHQMVATVPAQHLWGLETSVFLPLFAPLCVSDKMPFYPADITAALEELPQPRILVTTPTHLKALVTSNLSLPDCTRTLCATSPLSTSLAKEVETLFQGDLLEVYGCTEMGSLAYRPTSREDTWTSFSGFEFSLNSEHTTVSAEHVEVQTELQDKLLFSESGKFQLMGRTGDLINVGGKRGSLAQINEAIQSIPDVIDSAVFIPNCEEHTSERPVALVVSHTPQLSKSDIGAAIRRSMDPVFVPRPILFVQALPRNENSKLPKAELNRFYTSMLRDKK